MQILTVNGGSSSLRFALFSGDASLKRRFDGKLDRIGRDDATLSFRDATWTSREVLGFDVHHRSAARSLVDWLDEQGELASVAAIGHRVVQGLDRFEPELVTPSLLDALAHTIPWDPEHLPRALEMIAALGERLPAVPQVVCYDTAFHQTLPRVARLLAIPRRYEALGVKRYGFHGLSYAYLLEELARLGDAAATSGRVILAHLGSGASLAAVLDGRSIDTSMGITPTGGLLMSTRAGDLDPGLFGYLARTEGLSAEGFEQMVHRESGLLGVSETSGDLRDLLALQNHDVRAAEALALFGYQAMKWVGAFAAALGGLDTLVFSGGIGENVPQIRTRICERLGFLGIELDATANEHNAAVISAAGARVTVRVMRTDEELMIARSVQRVVGER